MKGGWRFPTLARRRFDVMRILTEHGYKPVDCSEPKHIEDQLKELEEWRKVLAELNELLQGL